jgi:hypothetical protein
MDSPVHQCASWTAEAISALASNSDPETRLTVIGSLSQVELLTSELPSSERGAARALCRAIHRETHAVLDHAACERETGIEWFVSHVVRAMACARAASNAPHATKRRITAILEAGRCLRNAETARRTMNPAELAVTASIVAAAEETVIETIHGAGKKPAPERKAA